MKTLSIIGCGNVGQTLAYLFNKQSVFSIQSVLTQSKQSAEKAVSFIGAGTAVSSFNNLQPADLFLIATPDDAIISACQSLSDTGILSTGNIIFQCSGSLPSNLLSPLVHEDIFIASSHPIKSFAQPLLAIKTFKDCYCALEGDDSAVELLRSAFTQIGGKTVDINPDNKTFYHAANVIVCNYLTSLIELGKNVYEKAGINNDIAMQMMQPLIKETLENNFILGTQSALTGPIARGDSEVVSRQIDTLTDWQPEVAELYKSLGRIALKLSTQKGIASIDDIDILTTILDSNNNN